MWDSETNLDYLGVISGKKKSLLHKTCSKFDVPSKGVVFVFDKFNYVSYPKEDQWRTSRGLFIMDMYDYCEDTQDPTLLMPSVIKKLAISMPYSRLIWLSRRAWDSTEVEFVWILSHELRHMEHLWKGWWLHLAGCFLDKNLGKVGYVIDGPKEINIIPTECDCELSAWRTTRQVISKSAADEYVHKNTESGERQRDFRMLSKYDPEEPYFVCRETIRILRKYQKQLDEIINEPDGSSTFSFYGIDVDYAISELLKIQETEP